MHNFFMIAASRKDDIEAMVYVLLYLVRGDLPWQNVRSNFEGAQLKRSTPVAVLCKDLSRMYYFLLRCMYKCFVAQWKLIVDSIRRCNFDEPPEYSYIEALLKEICGGQPSGAFNWVGIGRTINNILTVSGIHGKKKFNN
jgi:hypothetical protein